MRAINPHLEILPEAQRSVYPTLGWARSMGFVLYGGTAIALYCGHRESKDFDFFADKPLAKDAIKKQLAAKWLISSVLQDEPNTLSLKILDDKVQLSFFGTIGYGRVGEPCATVDQNLVLASPLDLLATKLKVLFDRVEAKDYKDIAALGHAGLRLEDGLAAAKLLFADYPEMECLRALTYFEGGDLKSLNEETKNMLRTMSASVRVLPTLTMASSQLCAIDHGRKPSGPDDDRLP